MAGGSSGGHPLGLQPATNASVVGGAYFQAQPGATRGAAAAAAAAAGAAAMRGAEAGEQEEDGVAATLARQKQQAVAFVVDEMGEWEGGWAT